VLVAVLTERSALPRHGELDTAAGEGTDLVPNLRHFYQPPLPEAPNVPLLFGFGLFTIDPDDFLRGFVFALPPLRALERSGAALFFDFGPFFVGSFVFPFGVFGFDFGEDFCFGPTFLEDGFDFGFERGAVFLVPLASFSRLFRRSFESATRDTGPHTPSTFTPSSRCRALIALTPFGTAAAIRTLPDR
jgi:hypothetical protein